MNEKPFWEGKHYSFHQNRECEFFPCHETDNPDEFSCLFCYCPLYALGSKCGGNYSSTETCAKDCSSCMIPHTKKGYGYIIGKYSEISELVEKQMKSEAK